jgi:macrolide transport system ATP-binding/permease protein
MSTPPRAAIALLTLFTPRERRDEVEGDLLEAFEERSRSEGIAAARKALWKEVMMIPVWRVIGGWRKSLDRASPVEAQVPGGDPVSGEGPGRGRPFRDGGQDLAYALRRMVRTPGSTAVAILILAIGVGGNATIFTMAQTLFVAPPPLISTPRELVGLDGGLNQGGIPEFGYYDFEFFRTQSEAFQDILAYGGFPGTRGRTSRSGGEVSVGGGDARQQAQAWVVSSNYFRVLGVQPEFGSGFTGEVGEKERAPEVVLSHGFWQRSFGGDPSVLDRPLRLNGVSFQVVGVTPGEFRGVNPADQPPDLFIPIRAAGSISSGFDDALLRFGEAGEPQASRFLRLVARLRPEIGIEVAQAEMALLQNQWDAEFGAWSNEIYGGDYRFRVRSQFHLSAFEARQLRQMLTFLWFVVGSVFLIACTNLALLLLAKAAGREREMGIRASLGAGRARLLRQLLTESLVLAGIGGALGVGVAYLAADAAAVTLPMSVGIQFRPNGTVVAFAVLLSGLAAVLFGTAPAWMLSRQNVVEALQRPGQSRGRVLFRGGLVAGQTAISIVLLIIGGLFVRSLQQAQSVDLGFERENRLLMSVQLSNNDLPESEGLELIRMVMDRLEGIPGVEAVSTANRIPFVGSNTGAFTAPGTEYAEEGIQSGFNLVGPKYFEVMGIPLIAGRGISRDDRQNSQRVAVVNEVFADLMWPEQDPLGRPFQLFGDEFTVVGVAKTAVYYSIREAPRGQVYLSQLQLYVGRMTFLVATRPEAMTLAGAVDGALREINPDIAVAFTTLDQLVEEQLSSFRIWTVFVSIFSGVALLLAMVGLYGVQSFLVARRTREIGIRIALGARASEVVRGVVRGSLLIAGVGTVLGVGAAFAGVGLVRGFLFGVAQNDPLVFTVVPLLLIGASILASVGPAARASKVNPVEALSQE